MPNRPIIKLSLLSTTDGAENFAQKTMFATKIAQTIVMLAFLFRNSIMVFLFYAETVNFDCYTIFKSKNNAKAETPNCISHSFDY